METVHGFGWNFYGFFMYAAVWAALYFVLVHFLNRHDK